MQLMKYLINSNDYKKYAINVQALILSSFQNLRSNYNQFCQLIIMDSISNLTSHRKAKLFKRKEELKVKPPSTEVLVLWEQLREQALSSLDSDITSNEVKELKIDLEKVEDFFIILNSADFNVLSIPSKDILKLFVSIYAQCVSKIVFHFSLYYHLNFFALNFPNSALLLQEVQPLIDLIKRQVKTKQGETSAELKAQYQLLQMLVIIASHCEATGNISLLSDLHAILLSQLTTTTGETINFQEPFFLKEIEWNNKESTKQVAIMGNARCFSLQYTINDEPYLSLHYVILYYLHKMTQICISYKACEDPKDIIKAICTTLIKNLYCLSEACNEEKPKVILVIMNENLIALKLLVNLLNSFPDLIATFKVCVGNKLEIIMSSALSLFITLESKQFNFRRVALKVFNLLKSLRQSLDRDVLQLDEAVIEFYNTINKSFAEDYLINMNEGILNYFLSGFVQLSHMSKVLSNEHFDDLLNTYLKRTKAIANREELIVAIDNMTQISLSMKSPLIPGIILASMLELIPKIKETEIYSLAEESIRKFVMQTVSIMRLAKLKEDAPFSKMLIEFISHHCNEMPQLCVELLNVLICLLSPSDILGSVLSSHQNSLCLNRMWENLLDSLNSKTDYKFILKVLKVIKNLAYRNEQMQNQELVLKESRLYRFLKEYLLNLSSVENVVRILNELLEITFEAEYNPNIKQTLLIKNVPFFRISVSLLHKLSIKENYVEMIRRFTLELIKNDSYENCRMIMLVSWHVNDSLIH